MTASQMAAANMAVAGFPPPTGFPPGSRPAVAAAVAEARLAVLEKSGGAAGAAASVGFKQGDRVRFVGQPRNSPSSLLLLSLPSVRGIPAIMSTEAAASKPEVRDMGVLTLTRRLALRSSP